MNINPFIDLVVMVLDLYSWILIFWIIMSWLLTLEIVNRYNTVVDRVAEALYKLTEPVLRRVRRYMPDIGMVDLSPIVVFFAIKFITNFLHTYFYTYKIH